MRKVLLGLVALVTASGASAADWVKISVGDNGDPYYLDASSIKDVGRYRSVWRKISVTDPKDREKEALGLIYFNCAEKSRAFKAYVSYFRDGTNESDTVPDYRLQWNTVVPDSVGETAFNLVCGQRQ